MEFVFYLTPASKWEKEEVAHALRIHACAVLRRARDGEKMSIVGQSHSHRLASRDRCSCHRSSERAPKSSCDAWLAQGALDEPQRHAGAGAGPTTIWLSSRRSSSSSPRWPPPSTPAHDLGSKPAGRDRDAAYRRAGQCRPTATVSNLANPVQRAWCGRPAHQHRLGRGQDDVRPAGGLRLERRG
jgi:hypothetical protein